MLESEGYIKMVILIQYPDIPLNRVLYDIFQKQYFNPIMHVLVEICFAIRK